MLYISIRDIKNEKYNMELDMKTICKRLTCNSELRKEIYALAKDNEVLAGVILSSVGSLKRVKIRLANGQDIMEICEPLEIISLNGTVSKERIHLHISCSKTNGEVVGGHLLDGVVNTTCELVVGLIDGFIFEQEFDRKTGYNEILIKNK